MGDLIAEKAKQFAILKQKREDLEAQDKILGNLISGLGKELFELFVKQNVTSFRISGELFADGQDRIISPDVKYNGTIEDETAFFTMLRSTGSGSLIKETVHHKTLESWIKNLKTKNQPLPPETMLRVFQIDSAKVRRAPKTAPQGQNKEE